MEDVTKILNFVDANDDESRPVKSQENTSINTFGVDESNK